VVSREDDRQFNLITTISPIQSPRRSCSEGNPPTNCIRFNKPRTLNSLSTRDVNAGRVNHQCNLYAPAGRVLSIRATSESTHLPMSKQINLVINGKGGVGNSFFASTSSFSI
jgi:hypothetical protein